MSTTSEDNNNSDDTNTCANCGKEGSEVTNTCNKCQSVKYCNAACKKKHRHKHKKDCEEHLRLAAERAAELHDEVLFKQPPSEYEDCPICFLRMPTLDTGRRYQTCCGKTICSGCIYEVNKMTKDSLCAFCRTPLPTPNETLERAKKRMEAGDGLAIFTMGGFYDYGRDGLPQDYTKALKLYHRSAELGCSIAYYNIGTAYEAGRGVEVDKKKAKHYYELAAIGGISEARYNLGLFEEEAGNMDRAAKHLMFAVGSGYSKSLKAIQVLYFSGHATKQDYTTALRSYQAYLDEIKSAQRDEAAAYDDGYKYYE